MAEAVQIPQGSLKGEGRDYYATLRREMDARKIPISLGKKCPVMCTFCYETEHSYRIVEDIPKTTQEDWEYILSYISKIPSKPDEYWVWGGNEYMVWTDLFLHPKAMDWLEDFLSYTDKNVTIFTVGFVHVPRIHKLAERYKKRINFELSVNTLSRHRDALMPNGPTVKQVLKILDGPAVTSADFYSFGTSTMSADASTISKINRECVLWMGCLTPLRGMDDRTVELIRQGKKALPEEAQSIYDYNLPNKTTIHTEAYITAFLNRRIIVKTFDSLGLEKRDTLVVSKSIYKILTMYRKKRARYLYIPNTTLGGDTDCTALLTLADIQGRITNEKEIYIPKCIIEGGRGKYRDICGTDLEDFRANTRCRIKVIPKINTKFANRQLIKNGDLDNYVEDYIYNPNSKIFENIPLPEIN